MCGVNTILHTLRGEQFRRLQNIKQSRSHLSVRRNFNVPSLPIRFDSSETDPSLIDHEDIVSWSGPAPPKSWIMSPRTEERDTSQWRAEALGIVALRLGGFPAIYKVPSLSLLCLQVILSSCTDNEEFREHVVPYIPDHLRRDLIRHCAIHSSLPAWKIEALWESDGHVDGEILIVGHSTILRKDHFKIMADSANQNSIDDWEVDDQSLQVKALQSLILLRTDVGNSTLLSIPPTLTTLALIDVSTPQPLHRLPKLLPLLVLLDLSYNLWLRDPKSEGYGYLVRVNWLRWSHLKILGLRDCYVAHDLLQKIEEGRWDGIDIIR